MSTDDEPTETLTDFVEVDWDDDDVVAMPAKALDECEQVVCLVSHMANLGCRVTLSGTAQTGRRCEVERRLERGTHVKIAEGRGPTWLDALEDASDLLTEQLEAEAKQNHA